jgi:hypothetical protein
MGRSPLLDESIGGPRQASGNLICASSPA